ncbi:MDIS1-interacting receptor like kinase 2-like [Eucalyptus grandis]|uniref:MDIS1-interacting receptor like kinase 2-like n=1 Tax=Eucalyptus grandis TaxID=71139 RepID=UPI00192ECB1E|nr:MDIS1-interacting receptor like kinase 2-like [Eucalyptus grandis]
MSLAIPITIAFSCYNSIVTAPAPSKQSEAGALFYSGRWPPSVTTLPHCEWPGVLCDAYGSVNGIRLPYEYQIGDNLRGIIPNSAFPDDKDLTQFSETQGRKRRSSNIDFMVVFIPLVVISCIVVEYCFLFRHATKTEQPETTEKNGNFLSIWNYDGRIAYEDIIDATEDFDLRYCIGTGGYGSVYRARLPNGKVVALKKLHCPEAEDPSFDKSFRNEVKLLTEVRHRSIIKLHGFCLHKRCMFLVYEYMENGSLFCALRDDIEAVELDWSQRVDLVRDMAHALSYMHHECTRPIVHRDISSNNILLNSKMQAFVSDFGTARLLDHDSSSNFTANIAGTYGYIAPGWGAAHSYVGHDEEGKVDPRGAGG